MSKSKAELQQEIALLEAQKKLRYELPYLYGWKHYDWSREFFEALDKECFLTAANQVGKSSIQIRKIIHWATETDLWPTLWTPDVGEPNLFWYLYPTKDVATVEFHTKWKQFLPRGSMKAHPKYGWKEEYGDKRKIEAIHFNTGVSVYFKTYKQNVTDLQTGTVFYVACFTKNHLVETDKGLTSINNIEEGMLVPTRDGSLQEVQHTFVRRKDVIVRYLSSGEKLEGTPDHKIWTENRGYVALVDLTSEDILAVSDTWEKKKKKYLEEKSIFATLILKIKDTTILPGTIGEKVATCIKRFGSIIGAKFLLDTLYITKTRISQTTDFLIWSLLQGLNTPAGTKSLNGKKGFWAKSVRKSAIAAIRFLLPGLHKKLQGSIVPKNVESLPTLSLANVCTVLTSLLLGKTPRRVFVLDNAALFTKKKTVYNISVRNAHNYYMSGINLANCDEELPIDYLPELQARVNATDGFFSLVFTATLGQEHWRKCMEEQGGRLETHKGAKKIQVSLFDCMKYEDGSPTHWTKEKIQRAINKCPTKAEVERRIYGKFVVGDGLKYAAFDHERNSVYENAIPSSWITYGGTDIGSGGKTGHPSAIVFVAVSPDYTQGVVYRGWRGDDIETSAGDVLNKFIEIKEEDNIKCETQVYDWASADFGTLAGRTGEPFVKAEKGHDLGEGTLNTLFKYGMLKIVRGDEELEKLVGELTSLLNTTPKTKAKDDFCDALRYTCVEVPWDYSAVLENVDLDGAKKKAMKKKKEKRILSPEEQIDEDRNAAARAWRQSHNTPAQGSGWEEIEEWQELHDVY